MEYPDLAFKYLQLCLTYRSEGLVKLSSLPGSMIRGAFGLSLKQMFCNSPGKCTSFCNSSSSCTYGRLFETSLDEPHPHLGNVKFAPHPFALYVPGTSRSLIEPGQEFQIVWTVWGEALRELPYSLLAWRQAGMRGFGVNRTAATLVSVRRTDTHETIYAPEQARFGDLRPAEFRASPKSDASDIRLSTLSPLRIKHNRELFGLERRDEFEMPLSVLLTAISRRVASCIDWHSEVSGATESQPKASSQFTWSERTRYSNRQKTSMNMGGVQGHIVLRDLQPASLALLQAGEILQIGKNTSMGLGKYKLEVEPH